VVTQLALAGDTVDVSLRWAGGLAVVPPTIRLTPGQESRGLRVLDFGQARDGWTIVLEGDAGRTYRLELMGERPQVVAGPARVASENATHTLEISFPPGAGRIAETVQLRRISR
jgi:hypothetical protein